MSTRELSNRPRHAFTFKSLVVLDAGAPIPGVRTRNGVPETGTQATFNWLPSVSNQRFAAGALQTPNHNTSFSGFLPSFNCSFVPG